MRDLESRLPTNVLDKAVRSGREYGWRRDDVLPVIEAAMEANLATIGGQVQFVFPGATCELYWMNYDSGPRRQDENWASYVLRSGRECISAIERLPATTDIEKEGIANFHYLQQEDSEGVSIGEYLVFILYFECQQSLP